jgi:hypothetical protein
LLLNTSPSPRKSITGQLCIVEQAKVTAARRLATTPPGTMEMHIKHADEQAHVWRSHQKNAAAPEPIATTPTATPIQSCAPGTSSQKQPGRADLRRQTRTSAGSTPPVSGFPPHMTDIEPKISTRENNSAKGDRAANKGTHGAWSRRQFRSLRMSLRLEYCTEHRRKRS